MKRLRIDSYFRSLLITIVISAVPSLSSKLTINPDGGDGVDYIVLDSALAAINRSAITVDTLLVTGVDQRDTLNWSITMTRDDYSSLVVRSTATNPDSFPAIRRSGTLGWNFFFNTNVAFENFLFRRARSTEKGYAWTNAQSQGKTHRFKNCIIKDQADNYFFGMEAHVNTTIIFENCLFEGNDRLFHYETWSGPMTISFVNCTFDNNSQLFNVDFPGDRASSISINNCIFSGNSSYFPGSVLKSRTAYSLTSESTSGYGTGCVSSSNPRYKNSTRNIPSDWQIVYSSSAASPAHNIGTATGAPDNDVSGYDRIGNPDAGCWEVHVYDFTWDASSSSGIQGGSGNWGGASANSYWTYDNGTTRTSWRGANNSASFAGSDGTYAIKVSGTQYVDSLTFDNGTYTLNGGTISFTGKKSIVVASDKTAVIGSVIAGSIGLSKLGGGTLTLIGANSYTGVTTVGGGTLSTSRLADGGSSSGIGAADSGAANLLIDGGELTYTGTARQCDRLFTVGTGGATISASGTGALTLTNTYPVAFSGTAARTLTLSGSNTGSNTLAASIGNGTGATALVKNGTGTWILSADHSYTGATTISAGKLLITGSIAASATTVASEATLGGTGSLDGAVAANGILSPGTDETGILTINNDLIFTGSGSYECAIEGTAAGTGFDQLVVNGTVTLGNAALALNLKYTPSLGQSYTIIDNDGSDALSGTFNGLSEGKRIVLSFGGTSYYCTISYQGGTGNDAVVTVESIATDYFWDLSPSPGFQGGDGTWGIDSYWSADGSALVAWPGAGNTATFAGADSTFSVVISGVQNVDSITFSNSGYTLNEGTLNLGTHDGIYVTPGKSAVIASVIDGSGGLSKYGSGTLILTGTNTYSGTSAIIAGTLQLGNGGETGSISGTIENNGSLIFNRSNQYIFTGAITGSGTVTKAGTGTLKLSAAHSYSGATSVSGGALFVNGSLASGSNVNVGSGATLGGTGSCNGAVIANGATVAPGDGGPGKLATGDLSLSGTSILDFDLGTQSDAIAVSGDLTLGGTINIVPT
ncbi:MAG: autotransporter-associated beta strand repeat-containing protein, partial [Chitinispirillaceae bacterium]|nr:autotransporter-associated beta strand repeat-containing protein [Chitinispirillaceae bacterium]